jgi:hypothetical protein
MKLNLSPAVLALPFFFAACSSTPDNDTGQDYGLEGIDHPEWITRGSGANGSEKKVLFGVGAISGVKNPSLARSAAGDRARAEISKVLEVYSASLMKDYSASVTAGDMSASSEEQLVSNAVKTFSANTLSGVEVVEHWVHPNNGTVFALAKLDIEGFMQAIDGAGDLDEKTKERVKRAAEKAFSDLEAEEAKQEAKQEATES